MYPIHAILKKRRRGAFARVVLALAALSACAAYTADARVVPRSSAAQCKRADTILNRRIRFGPGRTTAVVKDTIRLCTSHEYRLRARAGQSASVNLATGRRTSMTLQTPGGETLVDGGKDWNGELPETGEYVITIGTDATAGYTLEITVR
ncbi:MAG TPA: hypothetical protein VM934_01225 [Pyrinomonadaceae bacterium]|nr:hypothetical protein [Pyrinomonadaceae bacterium]